MLMKTKMVYQEGYLKFDVLDGKTMDIDLFGIKENSRF
jgi:hypothetical protein